MRKNNVIPIRNNPLFSTQPFQQVKLVLWEYFIIIEDPDTLTMTSFAQFIFLLALSFLFYFNSAQALEPPHQNSTTGKLPEIEAKTYSLQVVRKSHSNKVYLFKDINLQRPPEGSIVLLKLDDDPVMVIQVLKTYPNKNRIAGKWIKRYGHFKILDPDDIFLAVEKITDIQNFGSSEEAVKYTQEEDAKDIKEIAPYDPDLDTPSSPNPQGNTFKKATPNSSPKENRHPSNDSSSSPDEAFNDDEDEHQGISVEEIHPIENSRHWLTLGFGYIRNNAPPATGGFYNFSSGNLRYGFNFAKFILFNKPGIQDSLTFESGFFLYKALNFIQGTNDAYTLISIPATLRYNLFFSSSFALFIYGGVVQSQIVTSNQGQTAAIVLNSTLPAGGAGLLFQIGPSWYTRAELGIDTINMGIVLRF